MSDDLSIPNPTYRVPRHHQGMDPGTRKLAMIAGGLGATLLVVVGGWSVIGHRSTTVPVVQADNRPIRVKPDNPGGMQVAGAEEDILSGGTEFEGRQARPAARDAGAPGAARATAGNASDRRGAGAGTCRCTAAAPKPVVAAKPVAVPAVEKHAAASAAGNTLVQITAVHSEDAAKSEWQRLSKRLPDLLGQRKPAFSKTEHDGRTLWRVRTGGFSDVGQATSFCEKMRAKGVGCAVAEF